VVPDRTGTGGHARCASSPARASGAFRRTDHGTLTGLLGRPFRAHSHRHRTERKHVSYRKLIPVLVGAGLAGGLLVASPTVASADVRASDGRSAPAVHRKSANCTSPSGNKINISWGDGNVSTTVYYNNHCNQKRAIQLEFVRENGTRFDRCFVAPARTKGHKKIGNSMPNTVTILSKGTC
jgi:hypothetical protein